MRSAFNWLDNDGNGYLTEKLRQLNNRMAKLFPDMTQLRAKETDDIQHSYVSDLWNNSFGGKEKGLDYKMTEDTYIETCFGLVGQEGAEDQYVETKVE